MNATVNQATGELTGQIFDPQNTLRREVKETYSIDGGTKYESERLVYDFGLKGDLLTMSDYKFDLKGGLSYLDNEHFGLHGERTWEQKTTYKLDGFDTSSWHVGLDYQHAWTDETTTYKPPPATPGKPAKHATSNAQPLQTPPPSSMQVGVLFPRDFHAGETVTGSLWPVTYAEGFKRCPASANSPSPLRSRICRTALRRGRALRSASKMMAIGPSTPTAHFLFTSPAHGPAPSNCKRAIRIRCPAPAPRARSSISATRLPRLPCQMDLIGNGIKKVLDESDKKYLEHLWNLAYDLENDFNAAEEIKDDDFYWARMGDLEEYEYYLWEEIDSSHRQPSACGGGEVGQRPDKNGRRAHQDAGRRVADT